MGNTIHIRLFTRSEHDKERVSGEVSAVVGQKIIIIMFNNIDLIGWETQTNSRRSNWTSGHESINWNWVLNTGKAKTALRTKRTLMRSTTHELYVPHYQAWSVFGAWMLSIITHRKFPWNICYAEGHILVMAKGTDRILCRVSVDNNPLTRRAAIRPFRTSHWLASRQNIFVTWPSPSSAHRKEPINSCWMDGRKNECKHMEWRKLNPLNRLVGD